MAFILPQRQTKQLKLKKLGTVTVQQLSIGDVLTVQKEKDETKMMLDMVSRALVEPKITIEELNQLPMAYIDDFTKIVEFAVEQ